MRVAVDTNVLLSGLFFRGNERKVLQMALNHEITLVIPETVVIETLNNIRKKFPNHPELDEAKEVLRHVMSQSEIVEITQAKIFFEEAKSNIRHENDAPILAACMHAKPDCLITGDKDFSKLERPVHFNIMTARQFLEETAD